jgi:hypothetical protein
MTAAPNGNVYASMNGGDIYMQTGGVGNFLPLSQTVRIWLGMTAAPNGNVYASVYLGDIYMQTGGADSSGTAIVLAATASAVDTETRYVGRKIKIVAGTGINQASTISAYNGTLKLATIAWATTTDGTSIYNIVSDYDGLAAKETLIVVETNSIRYRVDGVAPAASVGQILTAGQSILIQGIGNLRKFRCIDTAAGASSVSVHVYF